MPGYTKSVGLEQREKTKCTCCPYGYHVDVDFLDYLNSANNEQSLAHLKRVQGSNRTLPTSHSLNFHIGKEDANHNYATQQLQNQELRRPKWQLKRGTNSTSSVPPPRRSTSALGDEYKSLPKNMGRGTSSDTEDMDETARISHLEGQRRLTRSVDPTPYDDDFADNLPKSFSFQQIRDIFEKNGNSGSQFPKSTSLGQISDVNTNRFDNDTKSESFYEIHDMLKQIESDSIASAAKKLSGTFSFQDDVFAKTFDSKTEIIPPKVKRPLSDSTGPGSVSDSHIMPQSTASRHKIVDGKWKPKFYQTKAKLVLSANSLSNLKEDDENPALEARNQLNHVSPARKSESLHSSSSLYGMKDDEIPLDFQRGKLLNDISNRNGTVNHSPLPKPFLSPQPRNNFHANLVPRSTTLLQQIPISAPTVSTRDFGTMFSPSSEQKVYSREEAPLRSTAVHLPVPTPAVQVSSRSVGIGVNFDRKPVLHDQSTLAKLNDNDTRTTLLDSLSRNFNRAELQQAIKQVLKTDVRSFGVQITPDSSTKSVSFTAEVPHMVSTGCGSSPIDVDLTDRASKLLNSKHAHVNAVPAQRESSTSMVVNQSVHSSVQTSAPQHWHKTTNTLLPMQYHTSTSTDLSHCTDSSNQTDVKIFLATDALTSIGSNTTTTEYIPNNTPSSVSTLHAAVNTDMVSEPEKPQVDTKCVGSCTAPAALTKSVSCSVAPLQTSVGITTPQAHYCEVMTQSEDFEDDASEVVTQTEIHEDLEEKVVTIMEDKSSSTDTRNTSVCAVCQQEFESISSDDDMIHDTVSPDFKDTLHMAQQDFVSSTDSEQTSELAVVEERLLPTLHSPDTTTERSVTTVTVSQSARLTADELRSPKPSDSDLDDVNDMYSTYPPTTLVKINLDATPLKPILKKSRSDPGSLDQEDIQNKSSNITSVSFADDVTGGFTSSSEEDEDDEDEDNFEDDSDDSFEAATYDISSQGKVEFSYPEQNFELNKLSQLPDQSIRETFELPEDVCKACQLLTEVFEGKDASDDETNDAWECVTNEWFKVSSEKLANPYQVEDYLSSFNEFSKELLKQVVNLTDGNGNTALHYAVSHCNFEMVSMLMDSELIDVNHQNRAGYSVIMLAALASVQTEDDKRVVRRLFQEGDVNLSAAETGQTALMLAASHGKEDTVELLLLNNADINIQDVDGSTALICAADHGHLEVARILLSHPECNVAIEDNDGSNALAIAVENEHPEVGVLIYAHLNFRKTA